MFQLCLVLPPSRKCHPQSCCYKFPYASFPYKLGISLGFMSFSNMQLVAIMRLVSCSNMIHKLWEYLFMVCLIIQFDKIETIFMPTPCQGMKKAFLTDCSFLFWRFRAQQDAAQGHPKENEVRGHQGCFCILVISGFKTIFSPQAQKLRLPLEN